jgi:hypothetical protein
MDSRGSVRESTILIVVVLMLMVQPLCVSYSYDAGKVRVVQTAGSRQSSLNQADVVTEWALNACSVVTEWA